MIAPTSTNAGAAAPAAARMQGLLRSWLLLAAIWIPGLLALELLVLQRLALTAAAMWTAALVPACQALALESLAAPLAPGAALARMARSLRARWTLVAWTLAAASVVAGWSLGDARLPQATAALLALAAAALFAAATRPQAALATARGAALTLALLLVLAVSTLIAPWLDRLPQLLAPGWPSRATRLLIVLPCLAAFFAALFRVQRRLGGAREAAADWLGAAAGTCVLLFLARLLPLRLDVTPRAGAALAPAALLVVVAACLAAAGTSLARGEAER